MRLLFLALGAAVVVTAGYFGWNYIVGSPQPSVTVTPANENTNENLNAPEVNINFNENIPAAIPSLNENTNNQQPTTNIPSIDMTTDSDHDGLTDYQEIYIYHTDPHNPDTDGDGYSDGTEVKNGYNPLGPGKLPPLP